jgi:P-type E1-E2 ATPase
MINSLKSCSAAVISELNSCEIRTVMATGDNLLTAQSVAKSCNILQDVEVTYLADMATNSETGKDFIDW